MRQASSLSLLELLPYQYIRYLQLLTNNAACNKGYNGTHKNCMTASLRKASGEKLL
jgi:hypothetical protein